MRQHLAPTLLLVAAAALVLWPLPEAGFIPGHPLSDVADHYWGAWWWGSEILAGRWPSHTALTHLPDGSDLWYVDPLGALVALLLRPLGPSWSFSLSIWVSVAFGGIATYTLVWRHAVARVLPALAAGLAVEFSPYVLGLLHSGLIEYLGLGWPALFWAALLETNRPDRRRWAVPVAALLLAVNTFQAFYYGLFSCLAVVCAMVGPSLRRRWRPLLGVLIGGILLSLPILWLAYGTTQGSAVNVQSAPDWRQPMIPATDLSLFLRPGRHYFPDTPTLGNPGILHVHYLGWVFLAAALWGFVRSEPLRRLGPALALVGLCTLGPAAAWWGQIPLGEGLPLPLQILYRIPGSPWAWVHHPYRLTAFLLPLLALGFAATLARLGRSWGGLVLGLVLVEGLSLSPAPWPLPRTDVRAPAIYQDLDGPGGVLDWPPDATDWNRRYEVWQVAHGRPIPYGVNVFLPARLQQDPLVAELLGALANPTARSRNRTIFGRYQPPRPRAKVPSDLAHAGLAWIVLHGEAMAPEEGEQTITILQRWLGEPRVVEGVDRAWGVPPGPVAWP